MRVGLETNYQLTGISKTTNGIETSLPWFGATRVRAGFTTTPNFLLYETARQPETFAQVF